MLVAQADGFLTTRVSTDNAALGSSSGDQPPQRRMTRGSITCGTHTTCSLPGVLPEWPAGTVMILSTGGEEPHAIPVSAALRAGPRRVLIGLAQGRESLARLRAGPRVALAILAEGDIALTAYGRARVVDEDLVEGVVAVEVEVERVQDHDRPTFVIEAGVRWRWTDPDAHARDAQVRAALERLARS
jgi:Pyridoxamine 5'-phosphate oxidase